MAEVRHIGDPTEGITSEDGTVRVFSRLAQTDIAQQLTDWVQAELRRPGADPREIILGLARFCAQIQASLAANFVHEHGIGTLIEMHKHVLDTEFVTVFHIARARREGSTRTGGHA